MIALAEHTSDFGTVTITESRTTRARSYRQGDALQSEADADGVSTASYVHALFGLIRQASARKILMIGCGGGTLATMLARCGHRVTIVDVNPVSFVFARRYFGLPPVVECHVADGLDFLAVSTARYDAIVLDAYDGDRIPNHFLTPGFLHRVAAAAGDNGCFLANVHTLDDSDPGADRLAATLVPLWSTVRILDEMGVAGRNTIVAAGAVQDLSPPRVEFVPLNDAAVVQRELAAMKFRPARAQRVSLP